MPRLESSGYKRYWPMRQLAGHNGDGSKRSVNGYRNMLSGEFHAPKNGWSGEPPALPSGEITPTVSDKYAQNYDLIAWNK